MILGLLAAGEGSRLRADGLQQSKGLVEVDGVPMVRRTIDRFSEVGVSRIFCIVNEESPDLREYLRSGEFPVPVDLTVESTPSSLHSLVALSDRLRQTSESHFFLTTVDAVYPAGELSGFVTAASERTGSREGTIAVTSFVEDESPLWVDVRSGDNRITAVGDDSVGGTWVTGGLYHFPVGALDVAERLTEQGVHRLRHFQRELVRGDFEITAHEFTVVVDVDHRQDIERAESLLRDSTFRKRGE